MPESPSTRIFISYARADLTHLEALEAQLSNLKRQKRITVWTDQGLEPGAHWEPTLLKALREAQIILLLVTPDFMNSSFIHDVELGESFKREARGDVRIIPVMVRPTEIKGSRLETLQGLPRGFQAVTLWHNRDQAWLEVVLGLRTVLDRPVTPQEIPQLLPTGYQVLPTVGYPPSALLIARFRMVPFFQSIRARELERIQGWLDDDRPFSVLLLTGEAGAGKTRLLCEVVQRQRDAIWQAGVLDARTPLAELKQRLTEVLAVPHPTLLAIDYAESVSELGGLLEHLHAHAFERKAPLRVLLTARGSGDWWSMLKDRVQDELSWILNATTPLELDDNPQESTPEALADLFQAGLQYFAKVRHKPVPQAIFDLQDARANRPLFCLLAALATVEGLPFQADTLLETLVKHERNFWKSRLPQEGDLSVATQRFLLSLVAGSTLRGGFKTRLDAERVAQALGLPSSLPIEKVLQFLESVYPAPLPAWVRPVEPDILGAALVRQALEQDRPPRLLEAALSDNTPDALATAFRVLEDIGQTHEPLATQAIQALLAHALEPRALPALQAATRWRGQERVHLIARELLARLKAGAPAALVEKVMWALPLQSLALMELGEWVTRAQLGKDSRWKRLLRWFSEAFIRIDSRRAMHLNNHGVRLSDLGRREEAIQATQESVTLYRRLAEKVPGTFLPDLAASIDNLGIQLSDLGRQEEALQVTQEAVTLRRRLAERAPNAFLPDLAKSLNNLGNRLSALGRREEALQATQEAVTLKRRLAEKTPDAFLPYLAGNLNNLGAMLSALGQREEALVATQESVTLFRRLAEKAPDAFLPDLAISLNNLGIRLSALGRREEALQATREAVTLYRRLAEKAPDAFLPDLAMSLNSLGVDLGGLGRREEALQAAREAARLYTRLFRRLPQAFRREWLNSLRNLRVHCQEAGVDPSSDPELAKMMERLEAVEKEGEG